jgi:hypothetical protein
MSQAICAMIAHRGVEHDSSSGRGLQQSFRPARLEQDELARTLLELAGVDQPPIQLTAAEEADLAEAEAEIARGELASADEVRAMWAKHGL